MIINNTDVSDELIDSIIFAVRHKKTLKFMDKRFINFEIIKFLSNHLDYIPNLNNKKSNDFEAIVKHVRSRCHDIYEIFQTQNIEKRDTILNSINILTKKSIAPLLSTHLSTKERLPHYETLYKKIFDITSVPKTILDIGCGLNPISIPYMNIDLSKLKYFASELSVEDTNFIENFFVKFNINGEAFLCNIVKEYQLLSKYPADACFAFKLFDVLESQEKNISYKIISVLKCKWLVASFSLKNIKNKKMKRDKPHYFERFLNNMEYGFETVLFENEIFYVVNMARNTTQKSKIL